MEVTTIEELRTDSSWLGAMDRPAVWQLWRISILPTGPQ